MVEPLNAILPHTVFLTLSSFRSLKPVPRFDLYATLVYADAIHVPTTMPAQSARLASPPTSSGNKVAHKPATENVITIVNKITSGVELDGQSVNLSALPIPSDGKYTEIWLLKYVTVS